MPLGEKLSGVNLSIGDVGQIFEKFFGDKGQNIAESIDDNNMKMEQSIRELQKLTKLSEDQVRNQTEFNKYISRLNLKNSKEWKEMKKMMEKTGMSEQEFRESVKGKWKNEIKDLEQQNKKLKFKSEVAEKSVWGEAKSIFNEHKHELVRHGAILKSTGAALLAAIHQSVAPLEAIDNFTDQGFFGEKLFQRFQGRNRSALQSPYGNRSSGLTQFKSQMELQRTFGITAEYTDQTLDDIASYPLMLNIANEEAMNYLDTLRAITGQTLDQNNLLLKQLTLVSNDMDVSYTKMFEMMSENAEFFAKYSGQGFENTVKAAGAARRLGLNFSSIAETLGGLTELDDILQRQMKASIFLGSEFNLMDAARQQFHGQTDKAMGSIMDQLSTISESQFDQPYIRQILSEQLGMSIGELQKTYRASRDPDKRKDMQIQANFNQSVKDLSDSVNKLGLGKLQKSLTENILAPLQTFFGEFAPIAKMAIGMAEKVLVVAGGLLKSMNSFLQGMYETFGKTATGVITLVGIMGGSAKVLYSMLTGDNVRNKILTDILRVLATTSSFDMKGKQVVGGTGFVNDTPSKRSSMKGIASKGWKGTKNFAKSTRGKVGIGLLATMVSSYIANNFLTEEIGSQVNAALSGGAIGATAGSLFPIPGVGTGLGALAGAGIGLATHNWDSITGSSNKSQTSSPSISNGYTMENDRTNMKTGGIVPDGYNNDTFQSNLSSQEAVIPLNSPEGEAFIDKILKSSGSKESITNAIKNMSLSLNISIKNTNDGREKNFRKNALLSDALVEVG